MSKLGLSFLLIGTLSGCTTDAVLSEPEAVAQTRSIGIEIERTNPYRLSIVQDALYDIVRKEA